MEWGAPQNLVWLWVVPAVWLLFRWASLRKQSQAKHFGDLALIQRLTASLDHRKRFLKRLFILIAFTLMALALSQPHFRTKEITLERKGIDVMIAVDVSESMLAKDIAPTRLEKAKLELTTLIDRLKQDRIGIVAFAGEAYIQCPLTLDKSAVKLFLSTLSPDLIPVPGTAIGKAIEAASIAFSEKDKEHKALILLTDGEDHGSKPLQAAKRAKGQGVRIFTIGIGTSDGSTLPDSGGGGFKKDARGQVVLSRLDEALLQKISKETGGVYYRSSRGEVEVESIVGFLRQMSQKGIKNDKIIEYEENFQYLVFLALLLLFLEMALSERTAERKRRFLGGLFVLLLAPFLTGFNFYSTLKNEEGNKHYEKGLVGKAKSAYESAHESDPESPEIAFNLGNTYYKEEAYDRSLDLYKKAALDEKSMLLQSKAFYNLGNALARKEELEKAKEFYKQALRLDPGDEDAKYNLELLNRKTQQQDPQQQSQNQKDRQQEKEDPQQKDSPQNQDQKENRDNQQEEDQQPKDKDRQSPSGSSQNEENQEDRGEGQPQEDQKTQDREKPSGGKDGEKESEKDQKESPGQGGEGQKDKEKPQGPQDEAQDGEQDRENRENEKEEESETGPGPSEREQEEREEREREREGPGGRGGEPEPEPEPQPKSPSQIRAEQILDALEGQEKEMMRSQGGGDQRGRRVMSFNNKDW